MGAAADQHPRPDVVGLVTCTESSRVLTKLDHRARRDAIAYASLGSFAGNGGHAEGRRLRRRRATDGY